MPTVQGMGPGGIVEKESRIWISSTGREDPVSSIHTRHLVAALGKLEEQRRLCQEAIKDRGKRSTFIRKQDGTIRPAFTPEEILDRTDEWIAVLKVEIENRRVAETHGIR